VIGTVVIAGVAGGFGVGGGDADDATTTLSTLAPTTTVAVTAPIVVE
jgi:hypothetical protein